MKVAETEAEWQALLSDETSGIVRSVDEFRSLLKGERDESLSSSQKATVQRFAALPATALEPFISSMTFKRGGLAHAEYGSVREHLEDKDLNPIWEVFGMGPGVYKDNTDYKCDSPGNCVDDSSSICTGNC